MDIALQKGRRHPTVVIILSIFVSDNKKCFLTDASNANITATESLPADAEQGEEQYFVPVSEK